MRYLIIIFTLAIPSLLSAQSIEKTWKFSISTGLSFPTSPFSNNDAINAAVYDPMGSRVIGINKSANGFAKTGFQLGVSGSFFINSWLLISANIRFNQFSVDENSIQEFLVSKGFSEEFNHEKYKVVSASLGIGYFKSFNKFVYSVSGMIGPASINYPYFQEGKEIQWRINSDDRNPVSALGSLKISVEYVLSRYSVGMESSYEAANFSYSYFTQGVPGFSPNPEIEDTIKFRAVFIGINGSYFLNKK